jgi:hypothetical protein
MQAPDNIQHQGRDRPLTVAHFLQRVCPTVMADPQSAGVHSLNPVAIRQETVQQQIHDSPQQFSWTILTLKVPEMEPHKPRNRRAQRDVTAEKSGETIRTLDYLPRIPATIR